MFGVRVKNAKTGFNQNAFSTPTLKPSFADAQILRVGPYRFFFFSNEKGEPPHLHIQRDRVLAQFWLNPPSLASSTRFSPQELRTIEGLVDEKCNILFEAWNGYFGYEAALSALGEKTLAQAIMQIVTINAWNRIAVVTHKVHEQ